MFFLEYRSRRPARNGLWGPFTSRSAAAEFAALLDDPKAAFSVVSLRNPDTFDFKS